jgi:hypothetical protein
LEEGEAFEERVFDAKEEHYMSLAKGQLKLTPGLDTTLKELRRQGWKVNTSNVSSPTNPSDHTNPNNATYKQKITKKTNTIKLSNVPTSHFCMAHNSLLFPFTLDA